jgi:type VI secretion system protein ImpE
VTANDLFKAGKLKEAIDAQLAEVKAKPADHGRRLFLFELAAFAGDLERARKQIDAVEYPEPELAATLANYRKLIDAETLRRRLFADGVAPGFLADAPDHAKLRLEAVNRLREGNQAEAAALLTRANAEAPGVKGTLNGKAFDGLRDADDLLGPVLEVLAQGRYFWIPVEQVEALALNPPKFARDLLWMPARLMMREGEQGEVFLPTLYPNSHAHPDEAVKLGRSTDWKQAEGGPVLGAGLKTFLIGDDPSTVLDWRQLELS